MSKNIQDKVVVITGASSGLGEATARHLAALGALVVLGARRQDRLDAIVAEIATAGGKAIAHPTDVTRKEDLSALVAKAVEVFGRIDAWPIRCNFCGTRACEHPLNFRHLRNHRFLQTLLHLDRLSEARSRHTHGLHRKVTLTEAWDELACRSSNHRRLPRPG